MSCYCNTKNALYCNIYGCLYFKVGGHTINSTSITHTHTHMHKRTHTINRKCDLRCTSSGFSEREGEEYYYYITESKRELYLQAPPHTECVFTD